MAVSISAALQLSIEPLQHSIHDSMLSCLLLTEPPLILSLPKHIGLERFIIFFCTNTCDATYWDAVMFSEMAKFTRFLAFFVSEYFVQIFLNHPFSSSLIFLLHLTTCSFLHCLAPAPWTIALVLFQSANSLPQPIARHFQNFFPPTFFFSIKGWSHTDYIVFVSSAISSSPISSPISSTSVPLSWLQFPLMVVFVRLFLVVRCIISTRITRTEQFSERMKKKKKMKNSYYFPSIGVATSALGSNGENISNRRVGIGSQRLSK